MPTSPTCAQIAQPPGLSLQQSLLIAVIGFLTLVDLFATQAILPSLAQIYGVTPAQIGLAANASTLGMAISGLLMGVVQQDALERKRAIALCLLLLSVPTASLAFAPNLTDLRVPAGVQGLFMAGAFTLTLDASRRALRSAHGERACGLCDRRRREQSDRPADRRLRRQPGRRGAELPVLFALLNLAGAALVSVALHRTLQSRWNVSRPLLVAVARASADPALRRTFAIGFLILFGFIGVFTYVGFVLMGRRTRCR